MEKNIIYLDNAATTKICKEAKDSVISSLNYYANPSSTHSAGMEVKKLIDEARKTIASSMHVPSDRLFFTSCGSEGNNAVIMGAAQLKKRTCNKIITTNSEHPSVENTVTALEKNGWTVIRLKTVGGELDINELKANLDEKTALVSIMHVNNETGAVYDIQAVKKAMLEKGSAAYLHCDNIQGYLKSDEISQYCDFVTVSGHKVNAPKGIGAMYIEKNFRLPPFVVGGGQQSGQRGGTEPVAMAQGLAKAAEMAYASLAERRQRVAELRELLLKKLSDTEGVEINSPENALEYVVNISVTGIRSEIMLHHLESRGVYVSSGSACSKGAKSHVLAAMGLSQQRIDSALRISFSAAGHSGPGRIPSKSSIRLSAE